MKLERLVKKAQKGNDKAYLTLFQLYEADNGVVHNANELGANTFVDERNAFRLDAADAIGLDVYLVG